MGNISSVRFEGNGLGVLLINTFAERETRKWDSITLNAVLSMILSLGEPMPSLPGHQIGLPPDETKVRRWSRMSESVLEGDQLRPAASILPALVRVDPV